MKEKKLEEKILLNLNIHQHMRAGKLGDMPGTYTTNTRYMMLGLTDLLVINLIKGKFTWVEVKVDDNDLQDNQKEFRAMCEVCDEDHLVARSLKDVLHLI